MERTEGMQTAELCLTDTAAVERQWEKRSKRKDNSGMSCRLMASCSDVSAHNASNIDTEDSDRSKSEQHQLSARAFSFRLSVRKLLSFI